MRVEHCRKSFRFFLKINSVEALLQYRLLPNRTIELIHTEVPPKLRNQGLARRLCREVFKFAEQEGLKVVPTCTYCRWYVDELATDKEKQLVTNLEKQ